MKKATLPKYTSEMNLMQNLCDTNNQRDLSMNIRPSERIEYNKSNKDKSTQGTHCCIIK